MRNKKKAFTLTELLVVVIVIGVLSAAVLPKFSRVIETRKTTEAEELMAAIRTEQERRCALDKPYLTDFAKLSDWVKTSETKNYSLALQNKGISAGSKGKYNYQLKMPSYADGRICCSGSDCGNLNKNYPSCEELVQSPNFQESPDSCEGESSVSGPAVIPCSGEKRVRQACTAGNTCGFETRTAVCNTATGEWMYGAWNKSACEARPATSQDCPSGTGTQTRSVVCKNGSWEIGGWTGTCTSSGECDPDDEEFDDSYQADSNHGNSACVSCGSEWKRVCRNDGTWGPWFCRTDMGRCGQDPNPNPEPDNSADTGNDESEDWYVEERDYIFQAEGRDQSCEAAYSGKLCSSSDAALSLCKSAGAGFVCAGNFTSPSGDNTRKVCFGTGYYCKKSN